MSYKLLLADDSVTIQKVVELILAEEDFEIKTVPNGEEALNTISSFKPDVVLADIEMPKINGYQLCENIKQNPSTSNIPVILLTGAFEPIDEELAKQVRADDFIIKPFESQELISKINSLLTASTVFAEPEIAEEPVIEAEAVSLAEASTPEVSIDEDLWAFEETPEEVKVEALPVEEEQEEIFAGTEEIFAAETEAIAGIEEPTVTELKSEVKIEKPEIFETKAKLAEVSLPSREEFEEQFKSIVSERINSFLSSLDIKESITSILTPLLKDSIEKVLWEVAPDLVERMLKDMLKGSLESLAKEVEKVIWETVPDLAETMISKEIERIRSEF